MPANSPLAYSPRQVSVGVRCLLPLPSFFSCLVYLRNCNNFPCICFVSLLFSSDTTLPISSAGRTTALWDLEEGGPTDADQGGNYNPVGMCIFMYTSFYVSLCPRIFFEHFCAYSGQVRARPWLSSLDEPVNALNYHFPLSASLCEKTHLPLPRTLQCWTTQ